MTPWNTHILHGEHIGSLVIRTHLLSGHKRYQATAMALGIDGNMTLKAQEFNSTSLYESMANYMPPMSPERIASSHSPAALWALSYESSNDAKWCPLDLNTNQQRLGGSVLSFNRSWHFCEHCTSEDIHRYGFSYWHTAHQLPAITHCYIHKTPLRTCTSQLRDLRLVTLPQTFVEKHMSQYRDIDILSKWSEFVFDCFEALKHSPDKAIAMRKAARDFLRLPTNARPHNKHQFENALAQLETDIGPELLVHIFRSYANSQLRKTNFLKMSLLNKKSANYKNPVSWLLILFWLRNKIDFSF